MLATHQMPSFEQFAAQHGKVYASAAERVERERLYNAEVEAVALHNQAFAAGEVPYFKALNHFSDRTHEEKQVVNGYKKTITTGTGRNEADRRALGEVELPDSVDWREVAGAQTAVKNQGYCGSCWTFAGTAALESHIYLETGSLFTLSEQEYVSCVENVNQCGGTGGCMGATAELLFEHAVENGISTEWVYPYTSYFGEQGTCKNATTVATIDGYVYLPPNEAAPLMQAVAGQPVSVSVDASEWHSYAGGVFNGCNTESPVINHAVLLAGYGTDEETGLDYYLIRNSWGPTWGENGYIRLLRTDDEETALCGTDTEPLDGTGCALGDDVVDSQYVCGMCGVLFDSSYPTGGALA